MRSNDRYQRSVVRPLLAELTLVARTQVLRTLRLDTACRYGGDEFLIMLPEVAGEASAATVAEKIRVHLTAPYVVDGGTIAVTASIGTAVYPVDGQDYGSLIQQSDIGMYRAKARSRATSRLQPATKKRPTPDAIECGHRRSGPVSDPDEPP